MKETPPQLAVILGELEAAGWVDAATRDRVTEHLRARAATVATPLYLRMTVGLGAWLSGVCFLIVMGFSGVFEHEAVAGAVGVGLMLIAIATLRWPDAGVFLRQMGLTLAVAGDLLILFAVGDASFGGKASMPAVQTLITLVAYPLFASYGFRLVMVLATVGFWAGWCVTWGHQAWLHFLVAAEWVLLLALHGRGVRPARFDPLAAATVAMLPLTVLLLELGRGVFGEWHRFVLGHAIPITLSTTPTKWLTGCALLVLLVRLAGESVASLIRRRWFGLAVIALGLLTWVTTPGVLVAVALLVLGFDEDAPVITSLAWLFLSLFLGLFYYSLEMTLATKAWTMMATGTAAWLGAWAIRRLATEAEGRSA